MSTPEIYRYDGENPPVKVGGVSALLPALVPISYQDFMNLTQEEQESGSYIVTNMPTLMNAYSLGYKDGLSAGQKLDQLSSDLTELSDKYIIMRYTTGPLTLTGNQTNHDYSVVISVPSGYKLFAIGGFAPTMGFITTGVVMDMQIDNTLHMGLYNPATTTTQFQVHVDCILVKV